MSSGTAVSSMSAYAILGCGSVGHAVADDLTGQDREVLIIDHDEGRVEALRDQDLNARVADIRDEDVAEAVADHDVVLIMSSDVEANKAAVRNIRERNGPDQFVVVRASDPVTADELRELGADVVINPSEVIADSALRSLESGELEHRARRLEGVLLDTRDRVAVVTHDHPDPDAIASAVALQAIAEHLGLDADVFYLGDLGHQENRAFANLLGVELGDWSEADREAYDTVAVVDHAGSAEGPIDDADILIDHVEHDHEHGAEFVDVRPNMSSTSTIMTKYIQEFDMTVSETVATALLYGIRAETVDFKRGTTPADLTAAAYLYPFANHDTLEQVESPSMSPETLDVLAEAIQNREVQGSHLVSNAGFVSNTEALAQAAQHLLSLEGVTTTAVFGIGEDTIHIAARSKDIRVDIGNVLEEAYGEVGTPSGHSTQAVAEIPLGIFTGIAPSDGTRETLLRLTEEAVTGKLFAAMGVDRDDGNGG